MKSHDNVDFRVLDATIRDGGLVNNFFFTDDFVKELLLANIDIGIDVMEIGYKSSTKLFETSKYGKWKFCKEEDIYNVFAENANRIKLAVMADVGRCDYKQDIIPKRNSLIDIIRVASYIEDIPEAINMIEAIYSKGYMTACNIMAISKVERNFLKKQLDMLGKSPVKIIYIVDSFGALYGDDLLGLIELFEECATKYNKQIGIHVHNNQQLALSNTILACEKGVNWIDATHNGIGRGAGNCSLQMIVSYLNRKAGKKYNILTSTDFINNNYLQFKDIEDNMSYGLQYFLTGYYNTHPQKAIAFSKDKGDSYTDLYLECIKEYNVSND